MLSKFLKKIKKANITNKKVYANIVVKNKISYNLLTNIEFKKK